MSLLVTLAADILVAILLVATIVSSVRLSRRITRLKADEAALRQTIGDLVMASSTAERAIVGLRATLDECDRTLTDRLATAERYVADLSTHVEAGESVIARIASIVSQAAPGIQAAPGARSVARSERAAAPPARPDERELEVRKDPADQKDLERIVPPTRAPVAPPASPNGERLGVAAAAALAMSERALGRLRSRAA